MPLEFDAEETVAIERIVARYPTKAAALLPVLHLAQDKFGALSIEAQLLVAHTLDVAPTRVREVVTFYEMFHEHPEGQFHLELCTNISCHLTGGDLLMDHLKKRLGIEIGHLTEDGMFSLMEVECLASCGSGPMMKVGMDYYEGLTEDALDALLDKFKKLSPSLHGRPYSKGEGEPHTGPLAGFEPKLVVIQPTKPATDAAPAKNADEAPAKKNEAPGGDNKTASKDDAVAPSGAKAGSGDAERNSNLPSFEPPPLKSKEKAGK